MSKPHRHPSEHLYTDFNVPTLTETYTQLLLIYRHKRHLTPDGRADYVTHGRTRLGQGKNIRTMLPRKSSFQHSHLYLSVAAYNALPNNLKMIENITTLKNKVKEYLKNRRYLGC